MIWIIILAVGASSFIQVRQIWIENDRIMKKERRKPYRPIKRKYVNVKKEDLTELTIDDLVN